MKNRIINKWMLSALLVAGLASCEMKDELSGGSDSGATGMLELGLSVQEPGLLVPIKEQTSVPLP